MPARTICLIRSQSDGPTWDGLRAALERMPDVTILDDIAQAAEARRRIPALRPEVIVAGTVIGDEPAIPLLAELRGRVPGARVVTIAGRYTDDELAMLARAGIIDRFLWADLGRPAFAEAHAVLLDGTYAVSSRELELRLLDMLLRTGRRADDVSDLDGQILRRVAEGDQDKEIAERFRLSVRTVEDHVLRLRIRFGARNRAHLAALAVRVGLIDD